MMESTNKHTILLVDDLPQNLVALKSILELPERKIITSLSGAEALQILLKETVSLILVDVQMPEMDGYEFVEIVKSHPSTANIPIMFVTAINKDPEFMNKAFDLGAVDFLFKPLNIEMTRKKVNSFLKIWDYEQELKLLNVQLQEKNQELESFAGILVHDLKTPLGNIKSLIEIIEEDDQIKPESQSAQMFDMIKTSTNVMSMFIEDLLHYTKNIQNNEDKTTVNLSQAVDDVLTMINPPQNVQITKSNLNHEILFQPLAIKQIVSNLISNAIKFNDKEITEITLSFDSIKNTFSVKDNGPGIKEKDHNKVFEMFQTLGNPSKGESSTGIGLNLVKKLVNKNEAKIKINSTQNSGTEFVIYDLKYDDNLIYK